MTSQRQHKTQRIGYHDGQLLTARDLRDDVAYETRMREMHVRAVHEIWGVAQGFGITLVRDSQLVTIEPGLAYDIYGREIILASEFNVPWPSAPHDSPFDAWWFDLVISYKEDLANAQVGGPCWPAPHSRPAWRWCLAGDAPNPDNPPINVADEVRLGAEIPLARFRFTKEGQVAGPDLTLRRNTQGLIRPHIASGQVEKNSLFIDGSIWDWSIFIDTKPGGFSSDRPSYFVSLAEHPFGKSSSFVQHFEKDKLNNLLPDILGPFVSISQAGRDSFLLHVRLRTLKDVPRDDALRQARPQLILPVTVNWIGIEPLQRCPPSIVLHIIHPEPLSIDE